MTNFFQQISKPKYGVYDTKQERFVPGQEAVDTREKAKLFRDQLNTQNAETSDGLPPKGKLRDTARLRYVVREMQR
jgi:hypothetical protein